MSSFAADPCFKTLAFVSASFLLLSLLRSGNIAVSFMRYFFITPDRKGGELCRVLGNSEVGAKCGFEI